ncbi:MAG TPA: reverse transcriptase domain-containing protein [Candidatus Angelobacter sp.]
MRGYAACESRTAKVAESADADKDERQKSCSKLTPSPETDISQATEHLVSPMSSVRQRLFDQKHLRKAWKAISKRKLHSQGLDGVTIKAFQQTIDQQIEKIAFELKHQSYRFTPARGVLLPKPGVAKRRPIKIPAVRDRVVLKAIALLIEERFSKYNLSCSYGYVKGRGAKDAIQRVRELANQGNDIVLEADITKFFDTVDREILIGRFLAEIKYRSLESLIREALTVELGNLTSFTDDEQKMFPTADSGIPQGGVLSPMLANFYLYPFDQAMMTAGFNLVRYADDFVVMCKTEAEAKEALVVCKEILEKQLHLTLHPLGSIKARIVNFSKGLVFLGTEFKANRAVPSGAVVDKFRAKVAAILDAGQGKSLLQTLTSLKNTTIGWGQCYRDLDVVLIYAELDDFIREKTSHYLTSYEFLNQGRILNKKQLELLGVPLLGRLVRKGKQFRAGAS